MVFQHVPKGISPVEVFGARPQTKNATSDFTNDAMEAARIAIEQ